MTERQYRHLDQAFTPVTADRLVYPHPKDRSLEFDVKPYTQPQPALEAEPINAIDDAHEQRLQDRERAAAEQAENAAHEGELRIAVGWNAEAVVRTRDCVEAYGMDANWGVQQPSVNWDELTLPA